MPDASQTPSGQVQGAPLDKLLGFQNFLGVNIESAARDTMAAQIIIRYAVFAEWRTVPAPVAGSPRLAKVSIGGQHYIWAHSLEPTLAAGNKVILLTWGTAQAVVLGKIVTA